MKLKAFFNTFNNLSSKQIKQLFLEGQSSTLKKNSTFNKLLKFLINLHNAALYRGRSKKGL